MPFFVFLVQFTIQREHSFLEITSSFMTKLIGRAAIALLTVSFFTTASFAQVNAVEFGKNRVQYQKFKWRYYQTDNFNTYFSQDGLELGKYVAQVAEKELPQLEEFIEYGLQRRANVVVYNSFDEMQQSNIGLGIDWQNAGGVTKLVNNKMLLYFDGNHQNLRRQIRQGIAGVLVANLLFGDDLGELAANQTLLDLPKWLTDGYIEYAAEEWSPALDDQLKNALLSGDYRNFYQLAFDKPMLAGHAFWYYIGNKYGRNKTTYLLYLSRIYRNLNSATNRIAKKKFKEVLQDLMTEMSQMYFKDIRARRIVPKGQLSVTEEVGKKDFIRFNANPTPRSFAYAVVEFKQGRYSVVLHPNFVDRKVILTYGIRSKEDEINPNYPIIAWDNKATRLAVVYNKEGKTRLFVYDVVNRIKTLNVELPMFTQVQDVKYMLDANTLLFSAVKSGQTDIFVYKIDKGTATQITNDVYDDLDPSFVAFPGKTGIIFSSNRPGPDAPNTDTAITPRRYNIFLVDNWNQSEFKQISQLTNVRFGNARYPSQYQTTHFTFVSDENGIANRYAGFFKSERAGLDTLVYIGDEVLRNPPLKEVDSVLREWNKSDIDSVGFISMTKDSTYVFPLTNYQSSLLETRTAGDNSLVSEVVRQGNYKFLYRLRVDENTLRRRNVTAKPTEYMKKVMDRERIVAAQNEPEEQPSDTTKKSDFFESEFSNERRDSTQPKLGQVFESTQSPMEESLLKKAKLYEYRPPKFFSDYVAAGINNTGFSVNRFQPYQGGAGPIEPANGNDLNGLIRLGTIDLFEDYRISGGFRFAPNLKDNDILFEFTNQKKRLDWGFTYFRQSQPRVLDTGARGGASPFVKSNSNYFLARLRYALDRVRSVRITAGPRFERFIFPALPFNQGLKAADIKKTYGQVSIEYVHDNTLNPAMNIWNGLRWKVYTDWFTQLNSTDKTEGKFLFNAGFDARHYLPLYRNVTWAVRAAGDFSWGSQKVIYYLGGVDGWLKFRENTIDPATGGGGFRYFDENNRPDPDADYTYQALAINLRGFKQNIANGNNAVVINSEIRVPVFTTFFNRPINNAFLRNFQLVQFIDLGTAWNGRYDNFERPSVRYTDQSGNVTVKLKAGGIGPFAGGYGFGVRSTLLGYFVRYDVAWQMDGIFKGKPQTYLALGLDF
jgi:Tol biopolymer transport system component